MQLSWPLSVAITAFLAAATVANHDRVGRAVTRARLRDFYAREGEEKSDAKLEKLLSTQCRDEAACDKALRKKYGRGLPEPGNLLTVLDGDVLGAYTYRASSAATEAWAKYRDVVPVDPLLSTPRQILATLRSGSTYLTLVVATCTCGFVAPLVPAHRAWLLLPLSLAWLGAVVVVAQPTPAELEPAALAAAARAAFEAASVVGRLGLVGAAFSALRALLGREHAGPLLIGFVLTILAMTRPTDHPPYDESLTSSRRRRGRGCARRWGHGRRCARRTLASQQSSPSHIPASKETRGRRPSSPSARSGTGCRSPSSRSTRRASSRSAVRASPSARCPSRRSSSSSASRWWAGRRRRSTGLAPSPTRSTASAPPADRSRTSRSSSRRTRRSRAGSC